MLLPCSWGHKLCSLLCLHAGDSCRWWCHLGGLPLETGLRLAAFPVLHCSPCRGEEGPPPKKRCWEFKLKLMKMEWKEDVPEWISVTYFLIQQIELESLLPSLRALADFQTTWVGSPAQVGQATTASDSSSKAIQHPGLTPTLKNHKNKTLSSVNVPCISF